MSFSNFNNEIARLVIFQRIELAPPLLKKIRKFFGRYLFTNFFTKLFLNKNKINNAYYELMLQEYIFLDNLIDLNNKNILSIGSGMCGLELIIDKLNYGNHFSIIEKNYISKKIKYGWDDKNLEAYNNLNILKKFINDNKTKSIFTIYNFDKDTLPKNSFDKIISLYSLDYHYDFNLYKDYFKEICTNQTEIIFDTIRPEYFKSIFRYVDVISEHLNTIHSSKRIICKEFIL